MSFVRPALALGWALAAMLILLSSPGPARATARWVDFAAASKVPSPFAERLAARRGRTKPASSSMPLRGLLVAPRGEGPFPAVVMVHDCRGPRPYVKEWARTVASWGYVTLVVNSFFTRHLPPTCSRLDHMAASESSGGRLFDAYGALEYLATLPYVDADRVAIMGWSYGAPLSAVSAAGVRTLFHRHFKAAVAFTPGCGDHYAANFFAPVLVLAAGRDDWAPVSSCERMVASVRDGPMPVDLHVYPEARHGFDDPELGSLVHLDDAYNLNREPTRGATLGYDGDAHEDATERVRVFLRRYLGRGESGDGAEVYALVSPPAGPAATSWAVDPDLPGPDLPPAGRSTFDILFVRQSDAGPVYDLPFPFTRLLERIEAELPGDRRYVPALKKVLIPLGRSLQRHAAAPDYFKHPRLVVAVDSQPQGLPESGRALFLKDRLFLGYQEKAEVVEVISYNESAARFEFQVVSDYAAGKTPRVRYARRAVCTSCHQNGAPLFAEAGWDETNTNTRISEALAREGREYQGTPVNRRCCPADVDNATDRANLLSAYQLIWREGCGGTDETGVRCRASTFTAMLQHRLSAYSHFDTSAPVFRRDFHDPLVRNWRTLWPDGLNIPNPNIPNRKPLLSPHPSHIPSELDPLKSRPPLAVWQVDEPLERRAVITGLAESLPTMDMRRLDAHLYRNALDKGARIERLSRSCGLRRQSLLGGAELVGIDCASNEDGSTDAFDLLADLMVTGGVVERGSLVRLELADGYWFANLLLSGAAGTAAEGRVTFRLPVYQRRDGIHARLANGNAVHVLEVSWKGTRSAGDEALASATARVTLEVIRDFAPVHEAIGRIVRGAERGETKVFSRLPFRGSREVRALFSELGLEPTPWCCETLPPMPPATVAEGSVDALEVLMSAAGAGVPPIFYRRCGGCHRDDTTMPPGFLRGKPPQVAANLSQCAERIYVRLAMWRLAEDERSKSPMPPAGSIGATVDHWREGSELAALQAHVRDLLTRRTGRAPELETLLTAGYETLPRCLPFQGGETFVNR